jgi:hypothetical protein
MATPRIVDTVVLRHFGTIDRLDILESRLSRYPLPRCSGVIFHEVFRAAEREEDGCQRILESGILGTPHEVKLKDFRAVLDIRRALSFDESDSQEHLGEAEGIFLADRLHGAFITDDGIAYTFAETNLGSNRVFDTVDLLREGVAEGELDIYEAKIVADAIRSSGRFLRSGHPPTLWPEFFADGSS